jgi:rhamnulokinase
VELDAPVIDARSLALNLTNEMGACGKTRLLKNIAGLWLLQECRRDWALGGCEYSYETLATMAASAPAFTAIIDPDAFLEPGDMPDKICRQCQFNGQQPPGTPASVARTIFESLALRYRQVLESLETLLGRKLEFIHIVGGGSRNRLLNQFVADATGRTVIAGPSEATAMGNILIQAMGAGELSGLAAVRNIVRSSTGLETFTPREAGGWNDAYEKFREIGQR